MADGVSISYYNTIDILLTFNNMLYNPNSYNKQVYQLLFII